MNDFYEQLLEMQCNFSKYISDKIFGNLSNHLFQKWLKCNNNIVSFLSRLDAVNKGKIFNYLDSSKLKFDPDSGMYYQNLGPVPPDIHIPKKKYELRDNSIIVRLSGPKDHGRKEPGKKYDEMKERVIDKTSKEFKKSAGYKRLKKRLSITPPYNKIRKKQRNEKEEQRSSQETSEEEFEETTEEETTEEETTEEETTEEEKILPRTR